MPVYEYKCTNGHTAERIVPISEFKEQITCEECRKHHRTEMVRGRLRIVRMVLQASLTGKPRFIGGGAGGFYSPTT
jgi:putative FmdB family regulatory protein